MASSASVAKKLNKKNLPKFELDVYSKIALNSLVVFSVHYLQEKGIAITVEEVVSVCFRLFPQSFALKKYHRWPDSAAVLRRLTDCREKGFIKGNSLEGFTLKFKGQKLAERTAKALGLIKPVPKKAGHGLVVKPIHKKAAAPVNKKKISAAPVKSLTPKPKVKAQVSSKPVAANKITLSKKADLQPVIKKSPPKVKPVIAQIQKAVVKRKTVQPGKAVSKQAVKKTTPRVKPAQKQVITQKPVLQKKTHKPVVEKTPAKAESVNVLLPKQTVKRKPALPKRVTQQVVQPLVVKTAPPKIHSVKVGKKSRIHKEQPTQLVMTLPTKVVKPASKPATIAQPAKQKQRTAIQPSMIIPAVPVPAVSKEEKAKAYQLVRAMERSDAYKQYKGYGEKSRISEFDFRDMLFATMESSPETLARNINLFKGYARLHDRQDLVVFLGFCEVSFSSLLKPSSKKAGKKK